MPLLTVLWHQIEFSEAAAANIAETNSQPGEDLIALRQGRLTKADLLAECLNGADDDRVQGWHDYVNTLWAYESPVHTMKREFELAGVREGKCDCTSKAARSVRVAGWLICDRKECSRVING